jgi:KDO2-lipid IV(A) lauroyltransferase
VGPGRLKPVWRWLRFHALLLTLLPLGRLPRAWGLGVFGLLGAAAYHLLPGPRRRILANVHLVHPRWRAVDRERFARRVTRALGRNAFDFVRQRGYSEAQLRWLVRIDGREHLDRAHGQGRGVICLSAHLGCWELIPLRLRAEGYDVAVVYRRLRSPRMQAFVTARRARMGIETLDRDAGARAMIRSLHRGALLGVLTDQRTRVESVRVPFLGRAAWTPTGATRLAMRTGAPVITVLVAMEPDGRHRLMIGPRVPIDRVARDASRPEVAQAVQLNTARCNEALGQVIEEWQEQWVWFHRRWDDA